MMGSWWLLWMVFLFVFLVPPLGYGCGYRRWGPPYPRYIQRRRGQNPAATGGPTALDGTGGPTALDHQAWGLGGDFVWMVMLIGVFWACAALWWR